jgi:PLP dependent protein
MHESLEKIKNIKDKIKEITIEKQLKTNPEIIAVTKKFAEKTIVPLLDAGHKHFGENKVQEAEEKWPSLRKNYKNIHLHMLGKLQSNKAKKAVQLFDFIHSLDSLKLANKLSLYEKELNKKNKIFIQVNIGEESQKSGVLLNNLFDFYNHCKDILSLNIIGLMCLPPANVNPDKYFKMLRELSDRLNLNQLSMGMSSDYDKAILNGSTYLRIGTAIFGERNT